MQRVELFFDAIRSPYDIAHIIQITRSIDAIVYTSGKGALPFDLPKVKSKVRSWNMDDGFSEVHYDTFEEAIDDLHAKGKYLLGTSGDAKRDFFKVNLPESRDVVMVFGTEATGLTKYKQALLDGMVKLPMDERKVDFLILPVVTSAVAYELYRQFNYLD